LQNNNESPPHKNYDIEEIKVHPDFNTTNLANDLALIRVGEQILFAYVSCVYISLICTWDCGNVFYFMCDVSCDLTSDQTSDQHVFQLGS
jgi:hypothetical protein